MSVTRSKRALVLWFTGLSGAGKTTIANQAKAYYENLGLRVTVLDGDEFRKIKTATLGFAQADIIENNKIIAQECVNIMSDFDIVIVSVISPLLEGRLQARLLIGDEYFRLIYFSAEFGVVANRDVKGLYAKALQDASRPMIGSKGGLIYEVPLDYNLELDSGKMSGEVRATLNRLIKFVDTELILRGK